MTSRTLLIFALLLSAAPLFSQRPVPAKAQTGSILITGATAHLGNGEVIANSAVSFENGKLTMVADATTIRLDRTKFSKVIDAIPMYCPQFAPMVS